MTLPKLIAGGHALDVASYDEETGEVVIIDNTSNITSVYAYQLAATTQNSTRLPISKKLSTYKVKRTDKGFVCPAIQDKYGVKPRQSGWGDLGNWEHISIESGGCYFEYSVRKTSKGYVCPTIPNKYGVVKESGWDDLKNWENTSVEKGGCYFEDSDSTVNQKAGTSDLMTDTLYQVQETSKGYICPTIPDKWDKLPESGWSNLENWDNVSVKTGGCYVDDSVDGSYDIVISHDNSDPTLTYHDDETIKCPPSPSRWGGVLSPGEWGNIGEWCKDGSSDSSCETFDRASCRR